MNNTFCILPFIQYSTYNNSKYRLCCMAKEPTEVGKDVVLDQSKMTINEIWNSDYLKDVRNSMLRNEALPECEECYHLERNKIFSSRLWENEKNKEEIRNLNLNNPVPKQFDFRLGNMCNLQCQMCNPLASHLVTVERSEMFENGVHFFSEELGGKPKNKKEALIVPKIPWDEIEPMLEHATLIKIIGGEPTVSPDMKKLLDYCIEHDYAKNIELSFYTNLTNINQDWLDKLNKFKNNIISCSLEGWGHVNEYLRYPSDWDHIWNNFLELTEYSRDKSNFNIRITIVSQILNVLHIPDFLMRLHNFQMTYPKRIGISSNQLIEPEYYSLSVAPKWLKAIAIDKLSDFLEHLLDIHSPWYFNTYEEPVREIINFIGSIGHEYNEYEIKRLKQVTKIYDNHRKMDVRRIFPEYDKL